MRLRGIDFGPCLDGAGLRGFGSGYWPHRLLPFLYNFSGSTFVSKTMTVPALEGNMPLYGSDFGFEPQELLPRSIATRFLRGDVANNVGLSNPGADVVLCSGILDWEDPFLISFMPAGASRRERFDGCNYFVERVKYHTYMRACQKPAAFGVQLNLCPNAEISHDDMLEEAHGMLTTLSSLSVPLMVKIGLWSNTERAKEIHDHPSLDALCVSNSIPYSQLKNYQLQGRHPLELFEKGSLSSRAMLPHLGKWLRDRKGHGITKPICAGLGIRRASDVDRIVNEGNLQHGVDSISFATVALVRPWRIKAIIRRAHMLLT